MKIARSSEMPWTQSVDHGRFFGRRKELGAGGRISCGMWELPSGKRSFPMHRHFATEEALFAVSGHAKVRTPEGETPISPGDYVSFPPGGLAHQIINDGTEPFIYLGLSSSLGVDVVEYPDSGKVACVHGTPPNNKRYVFQEKNQAQYWDGEE
jgi:uncharacterized cupin superfamily protein